MCDADIGLKPGQDETAPIEFRCGIANIVLAVKAEDHLVVNVRLGRERDRQRRHQRAVAVHVLSGREDRDVEPRGNFHQPQDARHQEGALMRRQFGEEILLDVDHAKTRIVAIDKGSAVHVGK